MKTFNIEMVDSGIDHVTVPFKGEGNVTFALKERTLDRIVDLRGMLAEYAGINADDVPSSADALGIMFRLAVRLVQDTIDIEVERRSGNARRHVDRRCARRTRARISDSIRCCRHTRSG